ncbi:hypothetical protein DYQ86_09070 [Acidobacteria bacterium AB60]|nr:hypothetical protein DYQ86_09070 [Acidobacteria bacterium AB60]
MLLQANLTSYAQTTAVISAIGALLLAIVNYLFGRRLEAWKNRQQHQLEDLRSEQQSALAEFQRRAQQELAQFNASLAQQERLDADRAQSRGEAYGEIWTLTGALSLFGSAKCPGASDLAARLSQWYFERGWLLTDEAKSRYFLIQEVLSFFVLHGLSFRRPADEILFGSPGRAMDELRKIRNIELGLEPRGDDGRYSVRDIQVSIAAWKSRRLTDTRDNTLPEQAWVLLQFVMSSFRTQLTDELQSHQLSPDPKTETPPPAAAPRAPKFL